MRGLRVAAARAVLAIAALGAAGVALAIDGPVDNCASLLGSLSKELHFARALAPGERTTFACPRERETRAAIGASRERVLRALGTPDRTGGDEGGAPTWTYVFASKIRDAGMPAGGIPELEFHFDGTGLVNAVSCERAR